MRMDYFLNGFDFCGVVLYFLYFRFIWVGFVINFGRRIVLNWIFFFLI